MVVFHQGVQFITGIEPDAERMRRHFTSM